MKHKRSALIGIVLLTTLLAACGNSSDSSTMAGDAAASSSKAAQAPEAAATAAAGIGGAADSDVAAEQAPEGAPGTAAPEAAQEIAAAVNARQVIKTASIQVEFTIPGDTAADQVEDVKRDTVAGATANLSAQATVLGGFVGSLDQSGSNATLVLRVPADKYDALLKAVGTVGGDITSATENAADVTAQVTDVESRISSAKVSVERVRALLAEATSLEDIILLESELSTREADLESWEGQLAVLSDQVSLSTISVSFTAVKDYVPSEKPAERSGFSGGLANGWDAFTSFLGGLAVIIGTLLPFTPFVVVLILLVWFIKRRLNARIPALSGVPAGMGGAAAGGPALYPQYPGQHYRQPAPQQTAPAAPAQPQPTAQQPPQPPATGDGPTKP